MEPGSSPGSTRLKRLSTALCADRLAHHRPRGLAPCNFGEARAIVHGLAAEPDRIVGAALRLVDGISLEQPRPAGARVIDRPGEHRFGNMLSAHLLRGEEAHHRP